MNGLRKPSFRNVKAEENQSKHRIEDGDRVKLVLKPDFFGKKTDEDVENSKGNNY